MRLLTLLTVTGLLMAGRPARVPARTGPLVLERAELEQARLFPGIWDLETALVPGFADSVLAVGLLRSDGELTIIPVSFEEAYIIRALSEIELPDQPVLDSFWFRMRLRARAAGTIEREHRLTMANRGMWVGAAGGGCAAAHTAVHYVGPTGGCYPVSVYRVDHPTYWLISGGATALGTGAGCLIGSRMDRRPVGLIFPEPVSGRVVWGIGGAVLGGLTGTMVFILFGSTLFGRVSDPHYRIDNDPHGLTNLPAAIAGLGIATELAHLGYILGRSIDRRKARNQADEANRRLQVLPEARSRPTDPAVPHSSPPLD